MKKEPLVSKMHCEDVVAVLKREILLRQYLPGDALAPEEVLARKYRVSRAMVREALSVLKANGYLESRRGKHGGTFVRNILESSQMGELFGDLILMGQMKISDLLTARLLIEPEAARLTAMRVSMVDLQLLSDLNEQSMAADTLYERTERNIEFHNTIGQLSGNPFYAISIRSFMNFTRLFTQVVGSSMPYIHDDRYHQELLGAFETRNPALAFELMYVHVSAMKTAMTSQEKLFRDAHLV